MYGTIYGTRTPTPTPTPDTDGHRRFNLSFLQTSFQGFATNIWSGCLCGRGILSILEKTEREGGAPGLEGPNPSQAELNSPKSHREKRVYPTIVRKEFFQSRESFFSMRNFCGGGGSQHCHWYLTDREESDPSTIITLKAAERAAI